MEWFLLQLLLQIGLIKTSLALSFSGLSGAIFSPLLSSWITRYGWQMTYRFMAICIFVLVLPALIVPWNIDPKEEHLLPYGYQNRKETTKVQNNKIKLLTISFLCMCLFTLLHTSITGISQHLSGIAVSIHLSATIGATFMSFTMIGNITTKLLIGFLSDLLSPIKAVIMMILTNCISLVLLFLGVIHQETLLLYIGSLMFGSIYSVGAVGIPMLTRYFFGNENYARTYSVIGFLTNVGSASSLTLIGYLYDFTQSYQIVFIIALCFHLINLIETECGIDGLVPYCPTCKQFRFPMFNSAISTIIFNPTKDKILLIKQYGKNFNVLVAGYITKGENAKETLIREIKEEVNLNVVDYTYNDNEYYQPSNTLMHNYAVVVDSEDFKLTNEVDEAHWYSIEEARKQIKQGSLAHSFLERYLKKQH